MSNCPLDNDWPGWAKVLTDEIRTKNVARVVVRRFGERTSICFDLRDGSKYDRPSRVEMAVAWMRETGRLSRGEFFIGCEIANGSASLHDKAIKRLARMGLIEKQAGVWVWAE